MRWEPIQRGHRIYIIGPGATNALGELVQPEQPPLESNYHSIYPCEPALLSRSMVVV